MENSAEQRPAQSLQPWQHDRLRNLSDIVSVKSVGASNEVDTAQNYSAEGARDNGERMRQDSIPMEPANSVWSLADGKNQACPTPSQHTDTETSNRKRTVSLRKLLELHHRPWMFSCSPNVQKLLKCATVFLFIPSFLAVIGAVMESLVYGSENAPNYHPLRLCCAGWIASPFILIRWFWLWPKRLHMLEMVFYLLFTAGFMAATFLSTISGSTQFYMTDHINSLFGGKTYTGINTKEDVYTWLRSFTETVYNDSREYDVFARELPGHLLLFDRIRLKQSRSRMKTCASSIQEVPSSVLNKCYGQYSRSNPETENFSSLQFTYVNSLYKNYAGVDIYGSEIVSSGLLNDYSIDGYWAMWSPNFTSSQVLGMVDAMRKANWIDHQTRQISVDFIVLANDLDRPVMASVMYMIEVSQSGKFLPVSPILSFSYFDFITDIDIDLDMSGSDKCSGVATQKTFLLPVYLAIVPSVIYVIFSHIRRIWKNWRGYFIAVYTYTELLWMVTIFMAILFRWQSIYYSHCSIPEYTQTIWPTEKYRNLANYEMLPIAKNWQLARDALAIALFLQFFNSLKYVASFANMDTLGATLRNSVRELAAFAFSFSIIFIGFVFMFHLIFGAEDNNYHSFEHSLGTLWLGLLGNAEFSDSMWQKKEWSLPLVMFFSFLTVFVILTVIIAIISNAYGKTLQQRQKMLEKHILVMRRSSLKLADEKFQTKTIRLDDEDTI